jgi:hypothetical protein
MQPRLSSPKDGLPSPTVVQMRHFLSGADTAARVFAAAVVMLATPTGGADLACGSPDL